MIKQIKINYPEFNLELEHKFKPGINILEEVNGYGKTVILNTIMSLYTGSYPGLRSLPKGTAEIVDDEGTYILSKGSWVGLSHTGGLHQYCMPGKIWDLDTSNKRRQVIVDLLGLDYNKFMEEECNKVIKEYPLLVWTTELEKDLNKRLKEDTLTSELISEDIMRYTAEIRDVPMEDFSDIDRYNNLIKEFHSKVDEYNSEIFSHNKKISDNKTKLQSILFDISNKTNKIKSIEEQYESTKQLLGKYKLEYTDVQDNASCSTCGSKLEGEAKQKLLDEIKMKGISTNKTLIDYDHLILTLKKEISELQKEQNLLTKEIDNTSERIALTYSLDNANVFGLDIKPISETRYEDQRIYLDELSKIDRIKQELEIKKDKLKSINILTLQDSIDKIKDIKRMFTNKLQEATESLPLDIELFKTQKNGELKETFSINYNGIDYFNLSTGNKMLVNIMLSNIFVDKLGLDIMLIDEASSISKDNLTYIKDLSNKGIQVILARATNWKLTDLK